MSHIFSSTFGTPCSLWCRSTQSTSSMNILPHTLIPTIGSAVFTSSLWRKLALSCCLLAPFPWTILGYVAYFIAVITTNTRLSASVIKAIVSTINYDIRTLLGGGGYIILWCISHLAVTAKSLGSHLSLLIKHKWASVWWLNSHNLVTLWQKCTPGHGHWCPQTMQPVCVVLPSIHQRILLVWGTNQRIAHMQQAHLIKFLDPTKSRNYWFQWILSDDIAQAKLTFIFRWDFDGISVSSDGWILSVPEILAILYAYKEDQSANHH